MFSLIHHRYSIHVTHTMAAYVMHMCFLCCCCFCWRFCEKFNVIHTHFSHDFSSNFIHLLYFAFFFVFRGAKGGRSISILRNFSLSLSFSSFHEYVSDLCYILHNKWQWEIEKNETLHRMLWERIMDGRTESRWNVLQNKNKRDPRHHRTFSHTW